MIFEGKLTHLRTSKSFLAFGITKETFKLSVVECEESKGLFKLEL